MSTPDEFGSWTLPRSVPGQFFVRQGCRQVPAGKQMIRASTVPQEAGQSSRDAEGREGAKATAQTSVRTR
jgi:hypothetical protein